MRSAETSDARRVLRATQVARLKSAFSEGFDQSFFFARSDRIRTAKVADALASHAPSQVARTAVTMLQFAVSGNAKTLGNSLVSFDLRNWSLSISLKVVAVLIDSRANQNAKHNRLSSLRRRRPASSP